MRSDPPDELLRQLPRVLNAGVDVNRYRPVTLAELDLESFQYWFDCDKLFRDHVVAHIAQKAYKMAGRFGTEKYEDAIYRLTKTILDYLPDRAEHGGMLALHYSHFELAFLSGMSERSVNRVLMRL